jgi:hypothetical protein
MNQEIAFIDVDFQLHEEGDSDLYQTIYKAEITVKIPKEPNSDLISKTFRCKNLRLLGEALGKDWGYIPQTSNNKAVRMRVITVNSHLGWKDLHDKVDNVTSEIEATINSIPAKQVPESYTLTVSLET